jgi:hypothetical protein
MLPPYWSVLDESKPQFVGNIGKMERATTQDPEYATKQEVKLQDFNHDFEFAITYLEICLYLIHHAASLRKSSSDSRISEPWDASH